MLAFKFIDILLGFSRQMMNTLYDRTSAFQSLCAFLLVVDEKIHRNLFFLNEWTTLLLCTLTEHIICITVLYTNYFIDYGYLSHIENRLTLYHMLEVVNILNELFIVIFLVFEKFIPQII